MGVSGDGFGVSSFRKHVLGHVHHRDAFMMRIPGEEMQHAFVIASFFHQIIENQDSTFGFLEPFIQ